MVKHLFFLPALLFLALPLLAGDDADLPSYLRDRGRGIPTSMFGTYVHKGEVLIYPFVEYYNNPDEEYDPSEFNYGAEADYRSFYRATEYLIFAGYGITNRLALELEAAAIVAELNKASNDPTTMPGELEESGLGDVQTQLNYYWLSETARRPGAFSYFETVYPFNQNQKLTGTSDFEFKIGSGVMRGFRIGTFTARAAVEYNMAESKTELGELALEYLKRLSPHWRAYLGVEGVQDEFELITEAQYHLTRDRLFLKINNAFGLTSKAPDWAPEFGVMMAI
jgi:hypothetical protein